MLSADSYAFNITETKINLPIDNDDVTGLEPATPPITGYSNHLSYTPNDKYIT